MAIRKMRTAHWRRERTRACSRWKSIFLRLCERSALVRSLKAFFQAFELRGGRVNRRGSSAGLV